MRKKESTWNMKYIKYVLMLLVVLGIGASSAAQAQSGTWYFKHFSTNGPIYPWYSNDNSWGYHATWGSGFVEMVMGEDWGTFSPYHPIPKQIYNVGSGAWSWFWENHQVYGGGRIDSTWDNFIDYAPASNRQGTEIMIWANYQNTQPIADQYNSSGQAVPHYYWQYIGGRYWNIYEYHWNNSPYWTLTFIDQQQQGGESIPMMQFVNWGVNHGFYGNNWYLMEIGAGWEYANGWASATSYGNVNY